MITVSEKAKTKMAEVLSDEGATLLRFGLQGGGCNGFQYYFAVEEALSEDDMQLSITDEFTLLIDPMSMMYLDDAEIDYKKDLMGETFVFHNPNTKHTCGCGSSVGF